MSRLQVSNIMDRIASLVNQDDTGPTAGSDEWKLWLVYINRAISEWGNSHDWEDLRKEFKPTISGLTNATIPLPTDFRKLATSPVLWGGSDADGKEWSEILPEQQRLYDYTDDWVQVRGDISNGFNLIWNPGTLSSGASITIQYFSVPTSLASPANVPIVPDSEFLIERTIGYILEARSDPRYQAIEARAREKLLTMIENASTAKYSSFSNPNPVLTNLQRRGFRFGRD